MKLILLALAACSSLYISQNANAYPPSNARSSVIATSSSSGRLFTSSILCDSGDGLMWVNTSVPPTGSCPKGNVFKGWVPAGNACCYSTMKLKNDSVPAAATQTNELSETFDRSNSRDSFWGYINTSSRSPSGGRGNSPQAKLDACMGSTQVDTYVNMGSSTDHTQCRADCDNGTKNGYCNQTQLEDGNSTQTNAACKDRCDCWMNAAFSKSYNCEGL